MADEVVAGGGRARHAPAATSAVGVRGRTAVGAVTAEAAMLLPVLFAFALGLVWVLAAAVTQVRVVDGAREAARAAARGDSDGAAVARGRQVAPSGARFTVTHSAGRVLVAVSSEVHGPGGLFDDVPGLEVTSHAVAEEEPR